MFLDLYKDTIVSKKDLTDIISNYKLQNFNIRNDSELVTITFYKIHWYSFLRKRKIRKIKEIIKNKSPINIFYDFKTTYLKTNYIEESE